MGSYPALVGGEKRKREGRKSVSGYEGKGENSENPTIERKKRKTCMKSNRITRNLVFSLDFF